jgi:hypothetical protein
MIISPRVFTVLFGVIVCFRPQPTLAAGPELLSNVKSQADLDGLIASTDDAAFKRAMRDHAAAILAAAARRPHVLAVVRTVESAPGKVVKINTTPASLKKAVGGDVALFDTITSVDLSIPNAGPHDARKVDPYDAAFFEHLGHVTTLESLNVIATKLNDDWIAPLGGLTNLKTLSFVNNGKLTDAGLAQLAGLRQLESFAFVGTAMQGHAFAKFEGWTKLKRSSFRGSSLDDEGLRLLCERFPNYESLSLAHAKFTDAGAMHLATLTKLKGLELGTRNATPQCLQHLAKLPLAYLQPGDGLDAPAGVALIKDIPTLRRLTLTGAKGLKDADLKVVAGMTQLEHLELNDLELPDERVPQLQAFAFLKSMRLVRRPQPYPVETQSKVKGLLPDVALRFD